MSPGSGNFLRHIERQQHLMKAASHVDKPSQMTDEELDRRIKEAQFEASRAHADFWRARREDGAGSGASSPYELSFGLGSNQARYATGKIGNLPRRTRRSWK